MMLQTWYKITIFIASSTHIVLLYTILWRKCDRNKHDIKIKCSVMVNSSFSFPVIVYLCHYKCVCNIHLLTSIRRLTQEIVKLLFQQTLSLLLANKFAADFNDIACKRDRCISARRPTFLSSCWTRQCPLIPVSMNNVRTDKGGQTQMSGRPTSGR